MGRLHELPGNWRRILGAQVRKLSPEQCRTLLAQHTARGPQIGDPQYRKLTGGYSSQSIDMEVTRKLGVKAGIIRNDI